MKQIICPNCHEVFTIDESQYKEIESQVRDDILKKELENQKNLILKEHEKELLLIKQKSQSEFDKKLGDQSNLIAKLESQVESLKKEQATAISLAESKKDAEIAKLKGEIANAEQSKKLSIQEAVNKEKESQIKLEKENAELEGKIKLKESEVALKIKQLNEEHSSQIKMKDDMIAYYKEMKARLSVKDIGESLEQYCYNEFNKMRSLAYPRAYFDKDNDVVEGTKGDFVFKNFDENGIEYLSIMFEMKNEADETKTKHKNEDFLCKLDEDRKKKGCKYAILVSLLEKDNEFYNDGIVDMSYKYPDMYVIRPQFFMAIIALLDGATRQNAHALALIEEEKRRQIDVENFEDKLLEFQTKFGKNVESARKQFDNAIAEIDKSIDHLKKTRDSLVSSSNQLRLADDKAQALSIKKLTKDSPELAKKFQAIETEAEEK